MKTKTKKRLGLVAVLLVLILAIGAAAGTTLAKYISSATKTTEIATVAEWGYTISTNKAELFSKQYDQNSIVKADNGTLDVVAETKKVVAPGTSSTGAGEKSEGQLTFTINGTSEVDAHLVIDVQEFNTVWLNYEADGTTYYPLHWTITAGQNKDTTTNKAEIELSEKYTGTADTDFAEELAAELAKNLKADGVLPTGIAAKDVDVVGSKVIIELEANKVTFTDYTLTLAWEWKFDDTKDEEAGTNYNVEDTILGWLANNNMKGGTTHNGVDEVTISAAEMAEYKYNLGVKIAFRVYIEQVQTGHEHA